MPGHWFRFYDEVLNDPKVQKLPPALFKFWVNCLCAASGNGGTIPALVDLAFCLRISQKTADEALKELISHGLVDRCGETLLEPHNWDGRQFQSDVSTPRVKRFRERQRNVSETASETAPDTEQITETDSEQTRTEKEEGRAPKKRAPVFEGEVPGWLPLKAWNDFLEMRRGIRAPPTPQAQKLILTKLATLRAQGHDPEEILNASTMNSWKGLFPPKKDGETNGKKPNGHSEFLAGAAAFALRNEVRNADRDRGGTGNDSGPPRSAFSKPQSVR